MATAVVIRPGETDFDEQERIQGALDLPLNERGRCQLAATIDSLRTARLDVIYASPTEPALTVARELGQALDVPVRPVKDLRSINQGLWEGMRLEDVKRKHPRVYKQWRTAPESVCPPEGETCEEAFDRVRQVLRKPLKRKSSFAIVVGEPLATMVAGFLRTGEVRLSGPICGCDVAGQIEVVDLASERNGVKSGSSSAESHDHSERPVGDSSR